jgi:hypothetical protein
MGYKIPLVYVNYYSYVYYVMREKLNPPTTMNTKNEFSKIYKTTFEDGTVYFSRLSSSKGYSGKTFISNMVSHYNSFTNNPLRKNLVTEFETRCYNEVDTVKCEIVFEGLTSEAMVMRDKLIKTTLNCGNTNSSSNNGQNGAKRELLRVSKEFSKSITNSMGVVVSYVDRDWAKRKGLWEFLNFSSVYPINPKFVEILRPIERF